MPYYKFKIINKNFEKESGTIEAINEKQVEAVLISRGNQIVSITRSFSLIAIKQSIQGALSGINSKDLVVFFRQFAVLISASINLSEALKILADQTEKKAFQNVLREISNDVDSGVRLSDAFGKHRKIFSEFNTSVVRSGETSGKLDESLTYLADEEEKSYEMIRKVKGAMIYPIVVMSAMLVVGILMMIFVVPKLISIFNEVGGQLPITTRILIAVSNFMVSYWYIVIGSMVGAVMAFRFYSRRPFGKKQLDFIYLKIPVFGKIIRLAAIVRFARSMSTLIVGGVTISNSLKIAKGIVSNEVFKEIINQTIIEVEEGNSISSAFLRTTEVPMMVPRMMMVGERTGKLDFVLSRVADFYAKELDAILDNLMVLLEPLIMIVMGVAVGVMATAIILPMYNLTNQF